MASAVGAPAGPVHLNFPFDRPLEPIASAELPTALEQANPRAALGRPESAPYVDVSPHRPRVGDSELDLLEERLRVALRPLLVAGPAADQAQGAAVSRFASATGVPLLADPLSGPATERPP